MIAARDQLRVTRSRRLAWILDACFQVPGTKIRFGWDGLIGLIPGIGDWIAGLFSMVIFFEAAALGVSFWVLMRMVLNIVLEVGVGVVPVAGDLFAFLFQANIRNVVLLERALENPIRAKHSAQFTIALGVLAIVVLLGAIVTLVAWACYKLFVLVR